MTTKAVLKRLPGSKIKAWTISDDRMQELSAAEDRDQEVAKLVKKLVEAPRDEVERVVIARLDKLYQKEINEDKNPEFSDGTQIFPNRKDTV